LKSPDLQLWDGILKGVGGGGASDYSVILPPWGRHSELFSGNEGYFAWAKIGLQNLMRRAVKLDSGDEDEPLAIIIWRLADGPEIREILRAGGAIQLGGIPINTSGIAVETVIHAVLKLAATQTVTPIGQSWKEFVKGRI